MKNSCKIFLFLICSFAFFSLHAQRREASNLNRDSVLYKSSWAAGGRLKSDGFSLNAEFTKSKRYKRSILFQVQFAYFLHPKQARQSSRYGGGGFFGDGFKSFVYGKQNTLFALYGGAGQKFLVAEKGKRHGVQIFLQYAAGLNIGILKPYYLKVIPKPLTTATEDDLVDVTYEEGVDNSFLDYDRIVGASGFGKGWKLKFLPGLHLELGMQFDFGENDSFIKTLEVGIASDFYYKKVPVMVDNNKFIYPSAFVGFLFGKRKEK
ncbi:MAG: hypothetical protein R2739_06280 [Chitinophagales bacterium]|nr:hypothetical protein [Bacteroidota bacterium]